MMKRHVIDHKHSRVNLMLETDVWFEPAVVIEILGAEMTLSPIHSCAVTPYKKEVDWPSDFQNLQGTMGLIR